MQPLQRHLWRTVKTAEDEEFIVSRRGTRQYYDTEYRDSYLLGRCAVSIDSYRRFEDISDSIFRVNPSKNIWTANPEGKCSTHLQLTISQS